MKHILTIILFFATLTVVAQEYSPCYTNNMAKGNAAFKQGKYSEAKTYYVTAKQCNGGNPAEAQKKINSCDAKIKARQEEAARRKAEQYGDAIGSGLESMFAEHEELEEEEAIEEEERKREEELRAAEEEKKKEEEPPVMFTEEMPEYPGGPEALEAFLIKEIKYPDEARKSGITGTVLVEFVVEKDGTVANASAKVPLFPDCDQEAIRAVESMPKWKPGKSMGKPVRCLYQIPVTFRL